MPSPLILNLLRTEGGVFLGGCPAVYVNGGTGEDRHVKITENYIRDFSEEGKIKFFEEYARDWDLIDFGLPIKD